MSFGTTDGPFRPGPERFGAEGLVELRNVSVRYGRRWVLRHLDLDILPGEHLALLGANGSGKTTLLRLIAGEIWPAPDAPEDGETAGGASGTARRAYRLGHGEEHDAVTARHRIRLLGPTVQDTFLRRRPDATGHTVVATGFDGDFVLRRTLSPAEERQLRKCLLRIDATAYAGRRFAELSRGEQRRLLIARGLVAAPAILCLDEICDGLDDTSRERLLALLERLAADGLTLVMATHRPEDLPPCIRRRLRLEEGRLVAAGPEPMAAQASACPQSLRRPVPMPVPPQPVSRLAEQAADLRTAALRPTPLIEVVKADVWRGRRRVLVGLDWRLLPGRHWRVTGPNGAGKSTFIKLLYGELRPAAGGYIRWFGLGPRVNIWTVRQRIGLVSDELQALHLDRLTARDCVATGFNASIGRVPALRPGMAARADHWLEVVGLTAKQGHLVRELSYGEMRRVLLARALVIDPEVLLLDEATSGLDTASRGRLQETLRVAAGRGTHVVMAGHRLGGDPLFTDELRLPARAPRLAP